MAKRSQEPQPQSRIFRSTEELDAAVRTLKLRIADVEALRDEHVKYDDPRVEATQHDIRDTILEVFGPNSPEFDTHRYFKIDKSGGEVVTDFMGGDEPDEQTLFEQALPGALVRLNALVRRLNEKREDLARIEQAKASTEVFAQAWNRQTTNRLTTRTNQSRKVFVVHGHEEGIKQAVARVLEKLDLEPIILHEKINQGRTIIEKFEKFADVGFAVVLLTADDLGCAKDAAPDGLAPRPRQNVIFELGFFTGTLGRQKVCVIHQGELEMLSDYSGVLYIPFADHSWRFKLATEIRAAGIQVDLNKLV